MAIKHSYYIKIYFNKIVYKYKGCNEEIDFAFNMCYCYYMWEPIVGAMEFGKKGDSVMTDSEKLDLLLQKSTVLESEVYINMQKQENRLKALG